MIRKRDLSLTSFTVFPPPLDWWMFIGLRLWGLFDCVRKGRTVQVNLRTGFASRWDELSDERAQYWSKRKSGERLSITQRQGTHLHAEVPVEKFSGGRCCRKTWRPRRATGSHSANQDGPLIYLCKRQLRSIIYVFVESRSKESPLVRQKWLKKFGAWGRDTKWCSLAWW